MHKLSPEIETQKHHLLMSLLLAAGTKALELANVKTIDDASRRSAAMDVAYVVEVTAKIIEDFADEKILREVSWFLHELARRFPETFQDRQRVAWESLRNLHQLLAPDFKLPGRTQNWDGVLAKAT